MCAGMDMGERLQVEREFAPSASCSLPSSNGKCLTDDMSDQWEWNCKIWTVTLRVWFGATEMETGDRKEKFCCGRIMQHIGGRLVRM